MANYKKSFNFRNGVQVDEDNFVVNANGLVGIGTTIPEGYLLNVYGDTRVTGVVTASQLNVGVATVGFLTATGASVSGVVTAASFSGSAAGLTGIFAIAVDGWHVSAGNISTVSNVGVGTTLPTGTFQVGVGVTINSDGNATYTGIITAAGFAGVGTVSAATFVGSGASITTINADNISSGTLSNSRLPSNISVTGVVTASSFVGIGSDLTLLNASNVSLGTLSNSRLPSNINVAGIVTASSFVGSGIGLTQLNASNVESGTLSNSRLPSDINVSGIVTATGGLVGNLSGTATTATSLTGTPNILVGITTITSSLNVATFVGIGTQIPTSEVQIIKNSDSLVEIVSRTNQARISIGQSVGVGRSTAVIRFGNANKTLDILNNDTGNINLYLHAGPSGIETGRFDWIYGQNNTEIMSLTYNGKLGLGRTNPDNTLDVVGTSTVTGNAFFGQNAEILGTLTIGSGSNRAVIGGSGGVFSNINLNNTSGITTLSQLNVVGISSVGIGTAFPTVGLDARGQLGLFNQIGISTTNRNFNPKLFVQGNVAVTDKVGIGTTTPLGQINDPQNGSLDSGALQIFGQTNIYDNNLIVRGVGRVGINSDIPIGPIDLRFANLTASLRGVFYPPVLTTAQRNTITPSAVAAGAIIYNSSTNKHQGYDGTSWNDFY